VTEPEVASAIIDPIDVCVIFGGQSSEHSISCLSAASVLAAIDRSRYTVQAVGITRAGDWYRVSDDPADWARDGDKLPEVAPTAEGISLADVSADVVFPVLHGPLGEDGTIQGALEMRGLPYVGSGVLASALTMDKQATKTMLGALGLPVGRSVAVSDGDWLRHREQVLAELRDLHWPVFVKPARAGSSVGITKVKSFDELSAAIEFARAQDRKVVVEESIERAREIECGVLAGLGIDEPRASLCAEIAVSAAHEFYDFQAKYLDNSATLTVPAEIPDALQKELGDLAVRAFKALGADGLARVDFFVSASGIVINEVNTMPGFTEISMFPRMWQASGMTYPEIVDHLIAVALDRGVGMR
jgi:D-alanine-D-alanine ligase